MKGFKDNKTGLLWLTPEIEDYSVANNPVFKLEDALLIKDFTKELNSHSSKQIETFITGGSARLGTFLLWSAFDNRFIYYCFEDEKLVGSVILSPNTSLSQKENLKAYIDFCKKGQGLFNNGIPSNIPLIKAQRAVAKAKAENNTDIEYLVVLPKMQGRGIGTRAVSSIVSNQDYFAPKAKVESLLTKIHTRNEASQRIFKKNGFEKCPQLTSTEGYQSLDDYVLTL